MRRLSFYPGALALAALTLAGAGCGGDDGDETTAPVAAPAEAPAALSKEDLIAQGDAICAEVNAAVGTVAATEADSQGAQAADLYSGMVERLKELGAPSDDEAGYGEFIAAAEQLAQAENDVQLAAERGEEEALVTAEAEASSALSSFQAAAATYGFEQCSEGPSAPVPGTAGSEAESEAEGVEEEAEAAPEEAEEAPETEAGGAGTEAGGGAEAGGAAGGGESGEAGGGSGGIGPG